MSASILSFESDRSRYVVGDVATITVHFDAAVGVSIASGKPAPVLSLSNGARAVYVSGSGTNALQFRYLVAPTDSSEDDLAVMGVVRNDAVFQSLDSSGEPVGLADLRVRVGSSSEGASNDIIYRGASVGSSDDDSTVEVITQSLSTGADLIAPRLTSLSATSGTYSPGSVLEIKAAFNEVVVVDATGGVPTLQLTAGGENLTVFPSYVSGTNSTTLVFRASVDENFPDVSGVDVSAVLLNGGRLTDFAGNTANIGIIAGQNNLARSASITLDGSGTFDAAPSPSADPDDVSDPGDVTPARIERITSLDGDGPFAVGSTVRFAVKLNEVVSVDDTLGVPMLVLSNGGRAHLVSGPDSDTLTFAYTVQPTDRNSQDLGVLGFAENDARILDAGGNRTDIRISSSNNLSSFGDVVINAQAPYLRGVDVIDDTYIAGETVRFTASFSEAVLVEGTPSLVLSNGGRAFFVDGSGTSVLTFEYVVPAGAVSQADIDISRLSLGTTGEITSAVSGNAASLNVRSGLLSQSHDVSIDTELPEGVIELDASSLKSGETANVTITFNESVANPFDAIAVSNGTLSALVSDTSGGSDNGAQLGRVWTGVFTPNDDIEVSSNTLILDNSKVQDQAGNFGVGLSSSNGVLIDTQGPQVAISGSIRPDNSRLITLNFGEPVSDLTIDKIIVGNGTKSDFVKLSDSKYTLVVQPLADNPSGSLEISLAANAVSDAMGNLNAAMLAPHEMPWDVTAPRITAMSSVSGDYTVGDPIEIDVTFSETVSVVSSGSLVPFLALDNGQIASYVSGSDSSVLRFEYVVQAGDEASNLDVVALIENGATLKDSAGNTALVGVSPGLNNLAKDASISIDGVVPVVTSIRAQADGLYTAGDEVLLTVQFSEDVLISARDGSDTIDVPPVLTLSNGSVARYVETPDRDLSVLHFVYEVAQGDNDIRDLDVVGLAENGAVIEDASGNVANVVIRSGLNNLSARYDVAIDADWPRIADIAAQAGAYRAGDEIEIAVAMSKGVSLDLTQGDPDLLLSNGSIAVFDAEASSSTKLMFTYVVTEDDTQSSDLSVAAVRLGNARMTSLVAGTEAQVDVFGHLSAPDLPLAGSSIVIDLSPPEVVSIELADTMLSAGETTVVTVTLSEPITQLENSYFTVAHGRLSSFSTSDDGVTWTALYTPLRNVAADDLVIGLDASRIGDRAGNLGSGVAQSSSYEIDSVYPVATLRSDTSGVATGRVQITVTFSEVLEAGAFTASDVVIENGSAPIGFVGPNGSNEYRFFVDPLENSTQPIKVRIPEGAVRDVAGNINPASGVLLQPVDTDAAEIVEITSSAGAYTLGDTVSLGVRFSEAVSLELDPSLSDHEVPELYLNNGQTARYVSGSGTDSWVFEYVVAPLVDEQGNLVLDQNGDPEVIDRDPLTVVSFLPNDTMPVDGAGVAIEVRLPGSKDLGQAVIVDTAAPVVAGFSAVDGSYALGDVVYITAEMSEAVFVSTVGGAPSLALSNGGTASYLSGSGTDRLLFRYVVGDGDADSADLAVASFDLNGATLVDRAENAVDGAVVGGVNDLAATHMVHVDATAPDVVRVDLVEDAGTASDVVNDGYYKAGTVVALEVTFDEAVVVDATSGTPVLNLSNGGLAHYVGHGLDGDGAPIGQTLRFEYTVPATAPNTRDLTAVGLDENGGTITDANGNNALLGLDTEALQHGRIIIDTKVAEAELSVETDAVLVDPAEPVLVRIVAQEALDIAAIDLSSIEVVGSASAEFGDGFGELRDPSLAVHEIVAGSLQVVSEREFTFAFKPSDLYRGDVELRLQPGAVVDLAGNALSASLSTALSIDTLTTSLNIIPVAGPFAGSLAKVRLYGADGRELTQGVDYEVDPSGQAADGQVQVTLLNGYRGPLLVEVDDTDPNDPDYLDEVTRQPKSLDGVLRTMVVISEPSTVAAPETIVVTPLTELAVRQAGFGVGVIPTALSDDAVAYNDSVAELFGLTDVDIARTPVTTTLDLEFDPTDGLDASEAYGDALATLSAQDAVSGSINATLEQLISGIVESEGKVLSFDGATAELVEKSANVVDLLQDVEASGGAVDQDGLALAEALRAVIRTAGDEAPLVTAEQLSLLGVEGVNEGTLGLAHRLIVQTADDGSEVDTIAKIDDLLSAALVALNTIADSAEANTAAANVTGAHFAALGYPDLSDIKVAALNSALDRPGVDRAQVGDVAGIEHLVATFENLLSYAQDPELAGHVPEVADYAVLGVTGSDKTDLLAILNAAMSSDQNYRVVDMEAVQSLVDDLSVAIDSFQLYSLEPDNYPAPDAEMYAKLLIDGADGLEASVNSVLADSDVTIGSSVRSEVQALVDSYAALNAYVSEEVGAVIPDHALLVGLGLSQLTDGRAETYLLDYLPDLGVEDVDRVSKLSAYVDAINALFYVADADPASIGADEAAISVAQLALLGHAIDPADHKTLLSYVAEQGDGAVLSVAALSGTVDAVLTAAARIAEYSEDPMAALDAAQGGLGLPSQADYQVVLAGTGVVVADVAAVNSALADADVVVGASDLQSEVRAVVEAYNAVLLAADGLDDDDPISVEQLSAVGVGQISSDVDMASLLLDVIDQRAVGDVATTADLQALSDAVRALEDTIANGVAATVPVTASQLALLGVVGATDDNIDALQITLSEGTSADYTSLSALQARVTTTVTALDKLTHHSVLNADAANTPVLQDYLDAGIAGVGDTAGDDNLLAVNAQLRLVSDVADKNSAAEIQALVTAANAALSYLTTTIQPLTTAPAAGTEGSGELSVDDQLAAYAAAGVTGVSADNLLAVNAQLRLESTVTNKDSVSEIQAIVAQADAAIVKVEQHTAQDTALTVADYEAVGVTGVADTAGLDNLAAVNAQVLLAADGDANSVAGIQALVTAGNDAIAYVTTTVANEIGTSDASTGTLSEQAQLDAYTAAGITGVTSDNLLAVNAQLRLESTVANKDSVSEIQAIVAKADAAIALIEEYNNGDGSTVLANGASTLTLADYAAAGMTGVSDTAVDVGNGIDGTDNLAAVNAQVLLSDTGGADSIAEIQALVTAGDDAISYLTTTIQPLTTAPAANNVGSGELSVDDQLAAYAAAGIRGVSADNLLAVNAQLRLETAATNKNSVSEIEAIVAKADAALSYLTTTIQPLTTAPAAGTEGSGELSVDAQLAAYAAAGVTGVSADNLLAVNAQLRLETDSDSKDSVSEIQAIVAQADAAIAKVETHTSQDTALTVADYEAVGVTGVADTAGSDNLPAVNAQVLLAADGDANSVADIQALVTAGNDAIAYVTTTVANEIGTSDASTGTLSEQAQLDAYTAAGITGVTSDNLLAVNAQLRLESTVANKDSVSEIQAIVAKADAAIALIEEYNNGDGSTVLANGASTLTLADYAAAGMTGVSDTAVDVGNGIDGTDNLAAVNAQVLLSDTGGADSIAEIQALVTAGDDAISYLTTTIQPLTTAPAANNVGSGELSVDDQLAAYAAAGIRGVSADNLLAVNAQLRLETAATNKNSVSEIEAIVAKADAALALIEEYNNGDGSTALANGATTLTIPDYEAVGIVGVEANNLFSVNRLMLAAATGGADTVGEIQALANIGIQAQLDALAKISAFADTLATSVVTVDGGPTSKETLTLTLPSLTAQAGYTLKVGNVILESGALDADPTPAELVTALQGASAYTLSPFTVALHQTNTNDLVITFKNVGERTGVAELRSEMPVVVDYENAGVTGADAENLYAINDGLMARTGTQADSTTEVQSLVTASEVVHTNALTQVLNYAAGTNTTKPSVRTYKLAGLTAVTESNLTAVNKIVDAQDSSTINDYATAASFVNAGVQAYEAALLKLANYANEVGGAATPDLTDYETAGITGLQAGDIDMINALMIQRETADDGIATTTTGIQSIVNQGLAAIFKIRDAAQNNTAVADGLTQADYEAVGVEVADLVNVGALNDALDSVAVTGADVRAYADLMAVVDAVKAVDALADGTDDNGTVDLTAADFTAMGVTGLDTTTTPESDEQVARLAILNDVLDRKDNSTAYPGGDADEVAEVQALHDAAQAVLRTAKGETPKVTETQLELLGFGTVSATDITADNLSAIQQVLINTYTASSDFTGINTLAKIETLTKNAVDALNGIEDAADNNAGTTTTLGVDTTAGLTKTDFAAMGVTTVTDSGTGSANNLAMVLSVLDSDAITAAEVTTYEQVHSIVDSVNTILAYVENGSAAPKIADFTTLGLTDITTVDQLMLMNSYLNDSNTTVTDIDSYDELQARLTAVNHILADAAIANLAVEEGIDDVTATYVATSDDLEALGFTYVDTSTTTATLVNTGQATAEVTPENIDAIRLAIANSSDDLSELQSFSSLKTLIEDTAKAANTIQAYGAGLTGAPVPTVADYTAIGVTGVTSLNLAAINSSLAETGVLDTITASVAEETQDIVNTWEKVQALADGETDTVVIGAATSNLTAASLSAEAIGPTVFNYTALNSGTDASDHPSSFVIEGRNTDGQWTTVKTLNKVNSDILPAFIGSSTNGYTITANGQTHSGDNRAPWRAADNNIRTTSGAADDGWVSNTQPGTLTVTLPQTRVVHAYTMTSSGYHNGFPASWSFQGRDFKGDWITLDSRSGIDATSSGQAFTFYVDKSGDYDAYRFTNIRAPAGEEIVLGEIGLWGYTETVSSSEEFEEYQVKVGSSVVNYASYEAPSVAVSASQAFDANASSSWTLPSYSEEGYAYVDFGTANSFDAIKVELPTGAYAPDRVQIYGSDAPIDLANISSASLLVDQSIASAQFEASTVTGQGIFTIAPQSQLSYRYIAVKVVGDGVYVPKISEITLSDTETAYTVYTTDGADGVTDSEVGKDSDIILLTSSEFASIGIKSRDGSSDLSARATELLNQLIDERGLSAVDDTSEIKAFAAAIEALLLSASKTTSISTPVTTGNVETHDVTEAQLQLLGFSLVDSNNYSSVLQYLTGSPAGDGYETGSDHLAQIRADLLNAITGLSEIETAAELNNATGTYPLASQWATINALTTETTDDVANEDVDSFNSMLNSQAVDGVSAKNATATDGLLSRITDYNAVLTAADGVAGTALSLTADEYTNIGIAGLEATSGQSAKQTAKLAILNEVIEGLAKTTVDTIPELQQVFDATDALLRTIDGETPAITPAELSLLGFTSVTADNLRAIQKALSDEDTTSSYDDVDSLTEVSTIVDKAVAALAAISDAALDNDAETRTDGVDATAGLTADDFVAMGVEGIDAANLPLILSALNDADIDNTDIFNLATTQALVNAAAKVVALAGDASAPKLVVSDLVKLGVDLTALGSGNTQANAIALLNDLISADSTAQATVTNIQTLVTAIGALMDDVAEATTVSLDLAGADLAALGFDATSTNLIDGTTPTAHVTANNIQAIRLALSATADDLSDLASLSDLQTLVDDTAKAANKIENYAEAVTTPTDAGLIPSVADFTAIGVTGVNSTNLSAILDSVASLTAISADVTAEVQTLVDAYAHFIEVADGTDDDDTAIVEQDYTDLGITLSTDAAVKAAQLTVLADAYDVKSYSDIDTIAELQAIADAVKSVLDTAKLDVTTTDFTSNGASIAELELLGIARVTNDNLASVRWILADAYNQAAAGAKFDGLDTLPEIQSLIANVVNALDLIKAYAADNSNPTPSVQTYTFAGVQGVTEDNLEAVNRQVDAAELGDVDTVVELETVVDSGLSVHLAAVNKVANYSQALATATSIASGDSSFASDGTRTDATPAQQSLALSGVTLARDDVLTLRVGTTTLSSDPLAGTTAANLLAALQASANYSDAPFRVSLNDDNTALLLDWKTWGEVTDTATLRSEQPSLDDYQLAGLQIAARTNDGVTAVNLYAVNASVEAATLTAVVGDATVAQVKTLLDSVETEVDAGILTKTTAFTKIETFADDTGGTAPVPTVADYALANIVGVTAENLSAVNTRLKAGNSTPGNALTEVQIDAAVTDANERLAQFENNTPTSPATAFTKADYEAIGITGISDTVVDAANSIDGTDNLLAVNAQIARAATNDANSILDIQWAIARANAAIASIEAYNNGTLGRELTIDDYAAVGINGVVPDDIHSINEEASINSVLALNSVSEIQGLVDSGKRSLQSAIAAIYRTSKGETPAATVEQLKRLGLSSLTDAEITTSSLSSIHKVMADYYLSDPSYLGSTAQAVLKTESLARTAIDALDAIKANAAANTSTDDTTDTGLDAGTAGLDAADFAAMGVSTVTDSGTGSANNLAMVLSVLDSTAITAAEVTTYEQVLAIVDSVNTILTYVETGSAAPKISDFTTLGLTDITTFDQLILINSYLNDSNTAVADIDSYDELQTRITAVNHILADAAIADLAAEEGIDDVTATYVATSDDLEALGFTYVDTSTTEATLVNTGQATAEVTPENIDAIRLAIANSSDDLSELQSFSALKTLIEDTAKAANTIQAYGAGLTGAPVPTVADYTAIGVTGVTSLNLAAINSSLAETGVLDTITASVTEEVQDVVDTWAKVASLADGQSNVTTSGSEKPTASEWASLGLVLGEGIEEQVASLLGDILDPKVFADVQVLGKLQSYVDALNALIKTTSLDYDSSTQSSLGTPDEGNGERVEGSNAYITHAQLKLLGLGALEDSSRTINGTISPSSRYDDALEFIADGSTSLSNDWEVYKVALINSISGLSKLEKVASLNNAVVANIATPDYRDYTAVGNFNPWGSQTGTVTLTNNWRNETLNGYRLISQTNDRWSFYRFSNDTWTTWYRFDYVRNENGSVTGGWTSRGMSGNHGSATPQFVNGRTDWVHNNLNVTVSTSINQSNIDAVKVLNSVLNTESIEDADTANLNTSLIIYRQILSAANGIAGMQLSLTADQYASIGIVGLQGTDSQSARQTAKLAILNEVIDGLAKTTVDTIPELQKVFDAVDALIRTIEGELPAITAAELSLLKFTGVNANNLSAIQKVLSDVDISSNYDAVDTLTKVKAIVSNAVAALEVLKSEANANDSDNITVALLEDMGVEGAVETGSTGANIALINSALDTLAIAAVNVDTLEEVQALVNVAAKVVALAGDASAPKLVASDLSKLGVNLTALGSGNTQANAIAVLNDLIIADSTAQTAVADIQTLVTALGALIDDVAEATATSLDLTGAALEALGFDATSTDLVSGTTPTSNITTNNIQAIRLALSATADDLSDLTSLSALQALVNDTAKAANKIENYAEAVTIPTDAGLIPSVEDFAAIGVTGVETNNLSAILNDLSQATSINNITADAQSIVSNHNQLGLDANAFISNIYVGFDGEEVIDSGVFYEDETPDIVLYLDSFTESDTIQLIVDGSEVNLGAPSAADIASGELIINNFNIATYDIDQNDAVRLQVQVSHNDGSVSLSDEKDYFFS